MEKRLAAAALIFGDIEPFFKAQLQNKKILRAAAAVFLRGERAREEAFGVGRKIKAPPAHTAVRSGAEAEVIAAVPVDHIKRRARIACRQN